MHIRWDGQHIAYRYVLLGLAVGALMVQSPAPAAIASTGTTGTCLDSGSLPCSVNAGQLYETATVSEDGNDRQETVEAVLAHVFKAPARVGLVAGGLTGSSRDFTLTPATGAHSRGFTWSYHGPWQSLAYLTVEASNGFAIFGIAGQTSGSVDPAGMLNGHDISHVGFWSTVYSTAAPVAAKKLHGRGLLGNSRLSKIENGTVPCMHSETMEVTRCVFTGASGSWMESSTGDRYALSGQAISLDGKPGGEYVVAAKVRPDGTVPAVQANGRDSAGIATGTQLNDVAVVETLNSASNASGIPLQNYATREVCTSSYPHPDGATLTRALSGGVNCYIGKGAALNDINGTERDQNGVYYQDWWASHVTWAGGYEVTAAKRPATGGYPAKVAPTTPIVWRPATNATIAN